MFIKKCEKRKCEKCGKESWHEKHQIRGGLCEKCNIKWLKYFNRNYERLRQEYPNKFLCGTWEAFLNKTIKEKVQFI